MSHWSGRTSPGRNCPSIPERIRKNARKVECMAVNVVYQFIWFHLKFCQLFCHTDRLAVNSFPCGIWLVYMLSLNYYWLSVFVLGIFMSVLRLQLTFWWTHIPVTSWRQGSCKQMIIAKSWKKICILQSCVKSLWMWCIVGGFGILNRQSNV